MGNRHQILDLSSGHSIRINLDGKGYSTESLLCLPVHARPSGVKDQDRLVGVLMLQVGGSRCLSSGPVSIRATKGHSTALCLSRVFVFYQNRQDLRAFTREDEVFASKFCGYLGAAVQSCLITERLFRLGITSRVAEAILGLPDATLTDVTTLCNSTSTP
jgi:hypothetical protein